MNSTKRVLFVVTSAATIGPSRRATGYEFSEVAHPALAFSEAGFEVDFASPAGGRPPEDGYDPKDPRSRAFREGPLFMRLGNSAPLREVDVSVYDAVFFPGGLGPMVDLSEDQVSQRLITRAWTEGKVLGAVCHGPVALLNVRLADGSRLVSGRHLTAFTSAEEVGHSEHDVPFMLDAALVGAGARHSHAAPFEAHVVVDGALVTGQNPASAAGVAKAMIGLVGISA
jgi:putative intracellular protease/amidase